MSRRKSRVHAGSSSGIEREDGTASSGSDTERTLARAVPYEDVMLIDKLYSRATQNNAPKNIVMMIQYGHT